MAALTAFGRRGQQLVQRHTQFDSYGVQRQHRRVVAAAFQAADHVAVQSGLMGQCLLAQIVRLAPIPNFIRNIPEKTLGAHPRRVGSWTL